MSVSKLPQVIILYGPPAAGKGTQAAYLRTILPDYFHLDFGTELRRFVVLHLGNYNNEFNIINSLSSKEQIAIALSLKSDMRNNLPAKTSDLRYVIEQTYIDCITRGQGMIVEGPGRLVEEAQWLSSFFAKNNVTSSIFHLHLDLEQAITRSITRYYLPSSSTPYSSLEAAKKVAQPDEIPFQRVDDSDKIGITKRYKLLYSDHFAKIISIYQLNAKTLVLTLDASQSIEIVTKELYSYLNIFFDFSV